MAIPFIRIKSCISLLLNVICLIESIASQSLPTEESIDLFQNISDIELTGWNLNILPKPENSANSIVKRIDDNLNLTCLLMRNGSAEELDDYVHKISWYLPNNPQNSKNRVTFQESQNSMTLNVEDLKESDGGEYLCEAAFISLFANNSKPLDMTLTASIKVIVKPKKGYCGDPFSYCPAGECIKYRFLCDGYHPNQLACLSACPKHFITTADGKCVHPNIVNVENCYNSKKICGIDAICIRSPEGFECECPFGHFGNASIQCKDNRKLICEDGRCIPHHKCCDHISGSDPNCTVKYVPSCCRQLPLQNLDITPYANQPHHHLNDLSFLQTTIYTVIGCAMAFMFIITLMIIIICRVHLKRTALAARFPPESEDWGNMFFNHPGNLPPLVTYNINNGVQFIGRPMNPPPPYSESEIDPPPPYHSHESLSLSINQQAPSNPESSNLSILEPLLSNINNTHQFNRSIMEMGASDPPISNCEESSRETS